MGDGMVRGFLNHGGHGGHGVWQNALHGLEKAVGFILKTVINKGKNLRVLRDLRG